MCPYRSYKRFCFCKIFFCKKIFTVVLFFATAQYVFARQETFRFYTVNNGLVSNHILSIFQDDDGFIWFGTFAGISIYDGHQFTNYTSENGGITDNLILGFFKKSRDETWVVENTCTEVFVKRKRVKKIAIKGYGFEMNSYLLTRDGRVLVSRDGNIFEIKNSE